jgi:hypothetical protein
MFQKATRIQKKLRMSLAGPSGSGKTYTALSIAKGLAQNGKIAVIDTERGSASLYSDRFTFDVVELDNFNPENYLKAITEAGEAGYSVLIIDSLSHAWFGQGGVLDQVNKRGGNSFTDGWGKVGTPLQNRLMDAILNAPLHVIATMRVKSEYVVEPDERGKHVPRRIGLKEVQREGVEYEFDIVGIMDLGNTLTIEKSRMPDLTGAIIDKPDGKIAARVLDWLGRGEASAAQSDQQRWTAFCKEHGFGAEEIEAALSTRSVAGWLREHNAALDDAMTKLLNWAMERSSAPAGSDAALDEAFGDAPAQSTQAATPRSEPEKTTSPTTTTNQPEEPTIKDCPIHGSPMRRQSGRNGGTFYSHKLQNGEWCNGKRAMKPEATAAGK